MIDYAPVCFLATVVLLPYIFIGLALAILIIHGVIRAIFALGSLVSWCLVSAPARSLGFCFVVIAFSVLWFDWNYGQLKPSLVGLYQVALHNTVDLTGL